MTKEWAGLAGTAVTFTANATALMGSTGFAIPGTILRTLGEILVSIMPTVVLSDECVVTFGLGLVSTDAAAVGATAMPDPFDEEGYDWLWWYSTTLFVPEAATGFGGAAHARIPVETRAMRRFKPNQSLALVTQYTDIVGTPRVRTHGDLRFLIGQ